MLLPTGGFRNYALITLSCGKAFNSCYAVAWKNYILDGPSAKTTVCDDSNFLGTRRKKLLITSESIHRVGSVYLRSGVTAACSNRSLAGCRWYSTGWTARYSFIFSTNDKHNG